MPSHALYSSADDLHEDGYEHEGALRPRNLRLRIVPTARSRVEGGLFDGLLIFAKGPENGRHEPYELALEVKALRGSQITPTGPNAIDTKVLVPGKVDLNVGITYDDIEVQVFGGCSTEEVLSRYAGFEHNGADRTLPAPTHFSWLLIEHGAAYVMDETEGASTVLAKCRWRPRGKLDGMK